MRRSSRLVISLILALTVSVSWSAAAFIKFPIPLGTRATENQTPPADPHDPEGESLPAEPETPGETPEGETTSPAPTPAPGPGNPPAPVPPPPVYVTGQAQGREIVAVGEQRGLNGILAVSWDGRRAALGRWTTDTNTDGVIDERDYPAVSYFDTLSRRVQPLFAVTERIVSVAWIDPDRVLFLRGRAKPVPKDSRGDIFLRVLPTGRETQIATNVVRFKLSPDGQQALLWIVTADTNGDGALDQNDLAAIHLVDLRSAQPSAIRLLSGFAVFDCSFAADGSGFYYIARREDTNRDGRLDEDDLTRAYFYHIAGWESRPAGQNIRGSLLYAVPAPSGGRLALAERDTTSDGLFTEDALYILGPDGSSIASSGILGQGREIVQVQWSTTGQRCAVTYRLVDPLGGSPYGVMIFNTEARMIRHFEAVAIGGVSYPSFLWNPSGQGYLVERRTEESDGIRPSGKSEFLAATGDEEAIPIHQPAETTIPHVWTGAGVLYVRYSGNQNVTVGLFARYRFSGTLSVFEPLTQEAGGLKAVLRPAAITAHAIYFRLVLTNQGDKEIPFDPAKITIASQTGEVLAQRGDHDLALDLDARARVDTLMQPYVIPAGASYGGFIAFKIPAEGGVLLKLTINDDKGKPLLEYNLDCQVMLEVY